jgi:hypothetical protein
MEDLLSKVDRKYFKDSFRNPLLWIMDERRKDGNDGVFNTGKKVFARKNLGHLNSPAKAGDEFDPAAMGKVEVAYHRYLKIVSILGKRVNAHDRKMILGSIPLFEFLIRDALTVQSHRIIDDDPVIAALKLAFNPYVLIRRLSSKEVSRVEELIDYIRSRMAAKVTSYQVKWCLENFPADFERCGLSKETVSGNWIDRVDAVHLLEDLSMDVLDFNDISDLEHLKYLIRHIETLIDDGQVFCFTSDNGSVDGYYVLRDTNDGRYFQQPILDCDSFYRGYGSELLEDEDLIDAILYTGVSPIFLPEEELKECGLAV